MIQTADIGVGISGQVQKSVLLKNINILKKETLHEKHSSILGINFI